MNSFSLKFNNPQNFYSTQDNTLSMFISLQLTFLHSYDQLTRSLCTWCNSTEVIVCPLKKKTGSWSKEGFILRTWIKKDKFLIKRNWSYWDEISQWTFHEAALLVLCLLVDFWFLWMVENWRTQSKTPRTRMRTNNNLNPHVTPGRESDLRHNKGRWVLTPLCHPPPPPQIPPIQVLH